MVLDRSLYVKFSKTMTILIFFSRRINNSFEHAQWINKAGATHVEPGNALPGTTPINAFHADMTYNNKIEYDLDIVQDIKTLV